MQRLRIALDPTLKGRHGSALAWAWRTLLTGLGYAWEEVDPSDPACDIAHTTRPHPTARIWVAADLDAWQAPTAYRLAGIQSVGPWTLPRYQGHAERSTPGFQHNQYIIASDIIFDFFWLLTGQEEPALPKNKHGYLELAGTPWLSERIFPHGLASAMGVSLADILQQCGYATGLPRWPHGKQAAACISHDVDYPQVIRWLEPLRILARQGSAGLRNALDVITGKRHHWHFASWMQLEQELGSRSAFYFMARKGSLPEYALGRPDAFYDIRQPAFRQVIAQLQQGGWEVGLHGSYEAYAQPAQFAAEKRLIEQIAGAPVAGHRHHYWHLDPQNPEATLHLHEQLGFRYDASLTNDHYLGWRRSLAWPFFPFYQAEQRPLRILQIPTGWMDDQLFGQQAANPGDRLSLLRALAATTHAQGGVLLADIHEYVFDDALFPGWSATLAQIWRELGQQGSWWFATPAEVASYWHDRAATITYASNGLHIGSRTGAYTDTVTHLDLAAST
ncbi:MAG: polysaccharide deacetylase family protein [Roseiflexaceae bacterium]